MPIVQLWADMRQGVDAGHGSAHRGVVADHSITGLLLAPRVGLLRLADQNRDTNR